MYATKKILQVALAIILAGAPFLLLAQDVEVKSEGDEYFDLVRAFYKDDDLDSTLHYLKLAHDFYLQEEDWEGYITCLNAFSSVNFVLNRTDERVKYARLAMEMSEIHLDSMNVLYGSSLNNYSSILLDAGNFIKAVDHYKQYANINRLAKDTTRLCTALKNIGISYRELGDTDQAIIYFEEVLAIGQTREGILNLLNTADLYRTLGILYYDQGESEKSIKYLKEAIRLTRGIKTEKQVKFTNLMVRLNYDLAKIYLDRNNLDSITYYVDEAFRYCRGDFEVQKDIGFQLLGTYYMNVGNFTKAEQSLTNAQAINRRRFKEYTKHISFSELNNLQASLYLEMGNHQKAKELSKLSINNLKHDEAKTAGSEIPSINNIYNPSEAIESYKNLGEAFLKQFEHSGDSSMLRMAHNSFVNASELIPDVRRSYQEETSMLRYSEVVLTIYESCISTSLSLFDQTYDRKYLADAFNFSEKSKAVLLLESINKSLASQRSNIPDSLLQKEKKYRFQIANLNKLIYDQENLINRNESTIAQLKRQLFNDTEAFDLLIRQLERDYPKYNESRYARNTATLADVQTALSGKKCQLIEYFIGENATYIFSVSDDNIEVNRVSTLNNDLADFQTLKDFLSFAPSSNIQQMHDTYVRIALKIYRKYVQPSIWPENEHLIIVNDGVFGYIPFEALITALPKTKKASFSLENQFYLMEEYEISYSYSATLFVESLRSEQIHNAQQFIGVAPSFNEVSGNESVRTCNDDALYSLKCSQDEVRQIKGHLGGKILIGQDATLQNTKREIANSKIIHLATHACLDDNNPEFNKIYLFDDYLSNNDLYNLRLNSELAVLSACETGSGKLAKGEGVMSLARGFIHAGCPSIVMSLWSIDDCATSKIMVNFYEKLRGGASKTKALRQAKLKYIQNAKKAYKHPYYWAAFVHIGNPDPIEISNNNYFVYIGLTAMVIFALTFFYMKRKRRS